jgi:hypothetical protein
MYCGVCPANRGAVEKPCRDGPWHQTQFLFANLSPARVPTSPAHEGREDETSARIAVVKLIIFMIWLKENELLQST